MFFAVDCLIVCSIACLSWCSVTLAPAESSPSSLRANRQCRVFMPVHTTYRCSPELGPCEAHSWSWKDVLAWFLTKCVDLTAIWLGGSTSSARTLPLSVGCDWWDVGALWWLVMNEM
jgi:hypothetical protein